MKKQDSDTKMRSPPQKLERKAKDEEFKKPLSQTRITEKTIAPTSLLEFNKLVGSLLMPSLSGGSNQGAALKASDSGSKFRPKLDQAHKAASAERKDILGATEIQRSEMTLKKKASTDGL